MVPRKIFGFRERAGAADNTIIMIVGILVVVIILLTVVAQAKWNETRDIDMFARNTAKNIASEVSAVSAIEQGVRFFKVSDLFTIGLDKESVSVTYLGEKGAQVHTFPHLARDFVPGPVSLDKVRTICISKKLETCVPVVTICEEGKECCNIRQTTCVFKG